MISTDLPAVEAPGVGEAATREGAERTTNREALSHTRCTCDGTGVTADRKDPDYDLCPCARRCGHLHGHETCTRPPGHRSAHRATGPTWPNILPAFATPASPSSTTSMGSAAQSTTAHQGSRRPDGDVGIGDAGRSPRPDTSEASKVATTDVPPSPSP